MKKSALLILLIFMASTSLIADINFNGYVQNWFSISTDNVTENEDMIYGFSNRRIRLASFGKLGEKLGWKVFFSFDKFSPDVVEAFLTYSVSNSINFSIGKLSAPGAASGSITSSEKLDFIERAPVTKLWGSRNALSGYRAVGFEMSGRFLTNRIFYSIMIANAATDKNNWMPSIKSRNSFNNHNGLAFWGRLEAYPVSGLKIGGFYGSGTESNTEGVSLKRGSSGAHIFYVKNNFNFKVEYISGEITGVKYNGMYVLSGFKTGKFEPLLRYDYYTPISGGEKFTDYTIGLNYNPFKRVKLQANYIIRKESEKLINNNIFYMNFQFSFDSKIK